MENKPTERPLLFKPLSEGLGFHPFSDGLPYAPVTKSTTSSSSLAVKNASIKNASTPLRNNPLPIGPMPDFNSGAGAMSAGPASFTLPSRPSVPMSPQSGARRVSVPVAIGNSISVYPPSVQVQNKASNTQLPGTHLSEEFRAELESGFSVIYLLKRTTAYVLDTLFNTGLCAGTFGFALWKQGISPETLIGPGMIFLFVLFLLTFNWAIMTAQEMAFGTTLGKRIFGLALEGSASAIFLRAFFFLPSAGFCGVGLLWAFFDRRKRCWHDLVVNLQPIEIARL